MGCVDISTPSHMCADSQLVDCIQWPCPFSLGHDVTDGIMFVSVAMWQANRSTRARIDVCDEMSLIKTWEFGYVVRKLKLWKLRQASPPGVCLSDSGPKLGRQVLGARAALGKQVNS